MANLKDLHTKFADQIQGHPVKRSVPEKVVQVVRQMLKDKAGVVFVNKRVQQSNCTHNTATITPLRAHARTETLWHMANVATYVKSIFRVLEVQCLRAGVQW